MGSNSAILLRKAAGRIRLEVNFLDLSRSVTFATHLVTKSTRGRVQFLLMEKAEASKLRIQLESNLPQGPGFEKTIPRSMKSDRNPRRPTVSR